LDPAISVRLRSLAISRLSALSLIVLILLPFTAPFPTFQLVHPSDSPPYDDSLKDVKEKVGSDAQHQVWWSRSTLSIRTGPSSPRSSTPF
jgi:hypothetical protein